MANYPQWFICQYCNKPCHGKDIHEAPTGFINCSQEHYRLWWKTKPYTIFTGKDGVADSKWEKNKNIWSPTSHVSSFGYSKEEAIKVSNKIKEVQNEPRKN